MEILEERWTPTTIQTTYVLRSLPRMAPKTGGTSIDFPLPNLKWTFALSLIPDKPQKKHRPIKRVACNWIPAVLSFRQQPSSGTGRWENASIQAQLLLAVERPPQVAVSQYDAPPPADTLSEFVVPQPVYQCSSATSICATAAVAPQNCTAGDMTLLATMKIALACTTLMRLPLETSCTISPLRPTQLSLLVTISECSFPNGFFGARLDSVDEARCQGQLVRKGGDRTLNRLLTTGKLFDVKFLTSPIRPTSRSTGEPLPTYASLSVLEEHLDLSSCILKESWTSALASPGDAGVKHVREILCPKGYEYDELDSDYEDEGEALSSPNDPGGLRTDEPNGDDTERSSNSMSFYELEEVSDQDMVDNQLGELIKEPRELPSVWVRFAAHRTWYAFLWYCYTNNLEFGELKSQAGLGGQRLHDLEGGPPTCSPKSMYRLADLLGDKGLKAKALEAIKERMTEANVMDETFSVFTSKYPDVREAELGVLMKYRKSPKVKQAFLRAMAKYGNMPHTKPVLSAFYDNLVA